VRYMRYVQSDLLSLPLDRIAGKEGHNGFRPLHRARGGHGPRLLRQSHFGGVTRHFVKVCAVMADKAFQLVQLSLCHTPIHRHSFTHIVTHSHTCTPTRNTQFKYIEKTQCKCIQETKYSQETQCNHETQCDFFSMRLNVSSFTDGVCGVRAEGRGQGSKITKQGGQEVLVCLYGCCHISYVSTGTSLCLYGYISDVSTGAVTSGCLHRVL